MTLTIEGDKALQRWVDNHSRGAHVLEVMLECMPELHVSWPMGPPFVGLVNLPTQQILYHPDVPDPIVVFEREPRDPRVDEPVFVVGGNGEVRDVRDLRATSRGRGEG